MIMYIILLVLCFALSAFFSASEMSISSANRIRLESNAEDGSRRAAAALKLAEHFDNALGAILIGNNLVNVASSSLASVIALQAAAAAGVPQGLCTTLGTVIVTVVVIICGETIPKIFAKKNATAVSMAVAYPVQVLSVILRPFIRCCIGLTKLLTAGIRPQQDEEDAQETAVEELQSIIETAEDEDVLDEDESELLQAALDFAEISASEVMTARVDMAAVDIADSLQDILQTAEQSGYSRLPVYEDDTDNIIGVLHLNTLYRAMLGSANPDIRGLLSEPCFVYKTVKLPKVLEEMRSRQTHLAIVTDEYGGTAGVISMEDVLECIVGEIWDETDEVEQEVEEISAGVWELDGDLPVSDLPDITGLHESVFAEFESETIGGLVMELLGGFAVAGSQVSHKNLQLQALECDDKRVEKVLLTVLPEDEDSEE